MRRGEIRWYTFAAPDRRRPVLLLTRDAVVDVLDEIIVAPITRTIRGIATLADDWEAEIARRAERVRTGDLRGRPADEVFDRLDRKLQTR